MDLLRSMPLGLYLEQPVTWLHRVDPRVKIIWLMSFLMAPILATWSWRLLLVGLLILLTLTARIPLRVWKQQMGLLLAFSLLLLVITMLTPDGLSVQHQPRLPAYTPTAPAATPNTNNQTSQTGQANTVDGSTASDPETNTRNTTQPTAQKPEPLPQPTAYRYILFKAGPIRISRRSLDLGIRLSTLIFTLIYATNLFLLTTAPEEITTGLESLMAPLKWLKLPVAEISLTLTLSLRFIPLVLEEIQNLVRSVSTRAINWKKLGFQGVIQIWLMVAERLIDNLLLRAEQTATAMQARGFTTPESHKVAWHQLRLKRWDWLILSGLILFWSLRIVWGGVV